MTQTPKVAATDMKDVQGPIKFSESEKEAILKIIEDTVKQLPKIKERISKIDIKGNNVYLYKLNERNRGINWIQIVVCDKEYADCALMLYKDTKKWIDYARGSLVECLEQIERISDVI